MAGLAVICTALAFLLYLRLITEAGPVRAAPEPILRCHVVWLKVRR